LLVALHDSGASVIPVVDPYFDQPDGRLAAELRALLIDFPSIAVAAALRVEPSRTEDLRTLGKWGVVEIISLEHDDTSAALDQRLRRMLGHKLKQLVDALLSDETLGRAQAILDAAAEIVVAGGTGAHLSARLKLSRRTLLRWTTRAGLPPGRQILAWMRILLAAELLDDPGRTVLQAARAAGYSTDSGLRRITSRFVGLSPTDMRARGAFAAAAKPFKVALAEARSGVIYDEAGGGSKGRPKRKWAAETAAVAADEE
jgi:AraC-like DNA-binding protein